MTDPNGQTRSLWDTLDPARAAALQATLGRKSTIGQGDLLPAFFHHAYFWDAQPPDRLGQDGHPRLGEFIPDFGLPRRMWAAGKLIFHAPLRAGILAEKRSQVERVSRKTGRSGPLAFVRVRHEIYQDGCRALCELQDLVYRAETRLDAVRPNAPAAPSGEAGKRLVAFDTTTLFRYSALTFNGHRIHYDQAYARDVEGYDGLVVHGPLLAQHLMCLAEEVLGPLAAFAYKATAPLLHHERAHLCWKSDGAMWVSGPEGRLCVEAQATPVTG